MTGANTDASQLQALMAEVEAVALGLRQRSVDPEHGLGPSEARLLQCLAEHGELTVPELARLRSTSRQNIQIMANRLAAEGCLEFNGNPAHKRSALVRLAETGRQRLQLARDREKQLDAALAAALAGSELSNAVELLQRMRAVLNQHVAALAPSTPDVSSQPATAPAKKAHEKTNPAEASELTPGLSEQPTDYGLPANLL